VCSSLNNLEPIAKNPQFTFVHGDICSADLVRHICQANDVDTIMHFASQTHVDNSFGNSLNFTYSNVQGTHTLLESVKSLGGQIRRFIHVSTDEVYGEQNAESDRSREHETPLNPTNPYAATKAAAEFIVKSYRSSFNLPTIITRGNNVYGPRQYPEKLIPKVRFTLFFVLASLPAFSFSSNPSDVMILSPFNRLCEQL
jgi:UDP-glucose 4,6-dehydratase